MTVQSSKGLILRGIQAMTHVFGLGRFAKGVRSTFDTFSVPSPPPAAPRRPGSQRLLHRRRTPTARQPAAQGSQRRKAASGARQPAARCLHQHHPFRARLRPHGIAGDREMLEVLLQLALKKREMKELQPQCERRMAPLLHPALAVLRSVRRWVQEYIMFLLLAHTSIQQSSRSRSAVREWAAVQKRTACGPCGQKT